MDEDQLFLHEIESPAGNRRSTELKAIRGDLDLIKRRLTALPTLKQLFRFGIWVALGLCVLALAGPRMWTRWVWDCGPLLNP